MNRLKIYRLLSNMLLSTGAVIAVTLGVRVARAGVDNLAASHTEYIVLAATPVSVFPPLPTITPTPTLTTEATSTPAPSPTPAPTSTPTSTPLPQPAVRIAIPAIKLNSAVKDVRPVKETKRGKTRYVWQVLKKNVGHHNSSGHPGAGGNIVLSGHNNTGGQVFRRLPKLGEGDEITLYTDDGAFEYQVTEKIIIPYRKSPKRGEETLQSYLAPTSEERLTLYSCYPYFTNANRIVVLAAPKILAGPTGENGGD